MDITLYDRISRILFMSPEIIKHLEERDTLTFTSKTFNYIATKFDLPNKRVLDIGCGYGEYMQRFGPASIGITTRAIEVEYGAIKKRDIRIGNAEFLKDTLTTNERFDVIWCNNILEHLLSPHSFLVHLKEFSHNETILILGTPIVPIVSSLTQLKKFRGSLAVEHINFFNYKTYQLTAEYAGWKVTSLRSFVFQNSILDYLTHTIAPHLYLIAQNNTDYHYPTRKLSEWQEDSYYQDLIRIMG
jgi:2-polyprenyl-3-methyl-5-hydroxy-6-metoxy-1,4-benzoquinol methylase